MRVEILSDEIVGREGGFMAIRRLRCVNVRADGSRSEPYLCDFLVRPKGIDAVVVVVYARDGGNVRVLLRDGLRLPLALGRGAAPAPDPRSYQVFRETVAGIIEVEDRGEDGIRRRAALEVAEEAGFEVDPAAIELLGAGTFASPGAMPEKLWLTAVEVDPATQVTPRGDGSPMEEGARLEWLDLDDAVAACVRGDIEDAKTEIVLRRLADRLRR
jgi:ADP-ribose pyrophosphatase